MTSADPSDDVPAAGATGGTGGADAYRPELARTIGLRDAIIITVSGISPIASVFIIAPVVYDQQGSGVVISGLLAAVICLGVALCFAELGSLFPVAGAEYSVVARVLGRLPGFMTFSAYLGVGLFGPSAVGLGAAPYVQTFWKGADPHLVGAAVILFAALIAMVSIRSNAVVTTALLVLQLVTVAVIVGVDVSNPQQPLSTFLAPEHFVTGREIAVTSGAILAGVALAITVFNGYDTPMILSEEIQDARRNVPRAIVWSLLVVVLAGLLPLAATVIGAPSVRELTTVPNPMSYVLSANGGQTLSDIVNASVILALFNGSIVAFVSLSRIFYSTGRDKAWPGPVNRLIGYVHPRLKTPIGATIFLGTVGVVVTAFTNLAQIVTFAALLLVVLYAFVALAALVSRFTQRESARPYRMPLWPLPPLVALVGCGVIISQQARTDLLIVGGILVGAALYHTLYLRPHPDTRWVMLDPVDERGTEAG